ncbi:ferrous iron transporter B [Tepidimicrobium xylanilyticum]|uniref:Ferrous iron transport protein B n=1 Tax=Tepidimicrobium xylanilyticum TaxID=1123352 RepID=A0A1H2QFK6_9FIRM|nr:ferrous iron transporter B [Tepidimicrobium xylanilyticum]GMG95671.1 iron transporter FeoB [Tepidimicrobium xylanilyticum]SDW05875.1 ferrous iron transport protein B [Tepidimicrobium xylanilyticum]
MSCHSEQVVPVSSEDKIKILLMGNPNVGKSVIFSKLTGVHVTSSNYVGTTVDYTYGDVNYKNKKGVIIDVPGTYSLEASSEAERVATSFLEEGADVIICVLDATNLARNLDLALSLREYPIPIVYSLNLIDVAERDGIKIDKDKLEVMLKAPVIPTVAIKNKGLRELLDRAFSLCGQKAETFPKQSEDERWATINEITNEVQSYEYKEPTFIQKLEYLTLKPWPGIPIALLVLILSLGVVVGGGKALRALILLPLVNNVITPFFTRIVSFIVPEGIFRNLLVGEFGILKIGIEWPFALILPYVFLFYVVFSFLEDSGYLPRIGVLADGALKKIGVQGGNIIPMMLGYGCAVPAILGTRAATTYKERIMVATLVSFAIPCASQSGAFFALLGDKSFLALILVYLLSFMTLFTVGIIMDKVIKGKGQPMLLEIPNLLLPDRTSYFKKLKIRMKHFLMDAEGPMFVGIGIAALVAETGVLNSISTMIGPLVEGWLGLPKEASLSLLLGIIRRELAVLPLLELDLSTLQLLVGSVVALFYLPCLAVFGVLTKEFSLKVSLGIGVATITSAFLFAGLINQIGSLILALVG